MSYRARVHSTHPDGSLGVLAQLHRDREGAAVRQRGQPRAGVVVGLRGETAAAELLADLVREGVPVSHFAPEGSRLENAYLGLHLDRDTAEGDRP